MASQYRRRSLMLNTIAKVAQGNPTIITDSSSRRLQKLSIYGQSEQDSTTGAQLFDILKATPRTNTFGLTVTIDGDYILINGSVENLSRKDFCIINTDVSFDGKICKAFDVTTTNCSIVNLVPSVGESNIVIHLNVTALENISCKFKLMVSDTEPTSYEPYTGGKPSPSPDYPQEIISKEVSSIIVSNSASESQTITLSEPITLRGIPVASGGNVTIDGQQYIADVITEKDGVIGVERRCKTFNVNPDAAGIYNNPNHDYKGFYVKNNLFENMNRREGYGSYIPVSSNFNFTDTSERIILGSVNTIMYFIFSSFYNENEGDKGLANFISYLTEHPLQIITYTTTPTFEPLPEEVQTQYKALKSYYPNTVIQTGCWNEVTYSAKRGG